MPTIKIQILSVTHVNQPKKNKPGETMPMLEIAYKNLTFQGKVEGRKQFNFGGNLGGYTGLVEAKTGDIYDIEVVKVGDFNEWQSAKKSTSDASPVTTASASSTGYRSGSTPTTTKSTYPTDEERAKVQVYIVRQSNLTAAINLLSVGAKSPPKTEDVIALAKKFEDHVFGSTNDPVETAKPPVEKSFDDLDDFPDMPQ